MTGEFVESDREHIFALRELDKFMVGHNGFIAGGCFKNIFKKEHIKDVDMFFECESDFDECVKHFESDDEYTSRYTSAKVVAYKHSSGVVVELVRSLYGKPEDIIAAFDFTIVKFAYRRVKEVTEEGEVITYKAIYHPLFFEHLHLMRLVADKDLVAPMSTFERMIKYIKYGYTPCSETKLKIIKEIRKLPEEKVTLKTNFYQGID